MDTSKKKHIIGIGCSWTQGEGGYTEEIWKEYNGRVQIRGAPDDHLRQMEHENSWVNVLCRDHFTDYTPVNLGVRGIGNRAAVKQLHFCDVVDWENSTGIIVLMMSGIERFDYFQETPRYDPKIDYYGNGTYRHYKWRTAWPVADHGGGDDTVWTAYAKCLYSDQFVASEQMCALLDLQTFAKAYGYKVVVANAFNQFPRNQTVKDYILEHTGNYANKFDWESSYIHNHTDYLAFVQKLVWCDGLLPPEEWGRFHNFYHQRTWPSEYLTNCEGAHPTLKGYKVIGDELAKFIKLKGYA